jgi:hypothetical protein
VGRENLKAGAKIGSYRTISLNIIDADKDKIPAASIAATSNGVPHDQQPNCRCLIVKIFQVISSRSGTMIWIYQQKIF